MMALFLFLKELSWLLCTGRLVPEGSEQFLRMFNIRLDRFPHLIKLPVQH